MAETLEYLILRELLISINNNHKVKSILHTPLNPITTHYSFRNYKSSAAIDIYIRNPRHPRWTGLTIELSSDIDFIVILVYQRSFAVIRQNKLPNSEDIYDDIYKYNLHDPNYESQISELLIKIAEESSV